MTRLVPLLGFATLALAMAAGQAPTPPPAKFSCNTTTGVCAADTKGTQTEADCKTVCKATPKPTPKPQAPTPPPAKPTPKPQAPTPPPPPGPYTCNRKTFTCEPNPAGLIDDKANCDALCVEFNGPCRVANGPQTLTCGAGQFCFIPPQPDIPNWGCQPCASGTYSIPSSFADYGHPQCAGGTACKAGYKGPRGAENSKDASCTPCAVNTYAACSQYCYLSGQTGAPGFIQPVGSDCPPPSPKAPNGYTSFPLGDYTDCLDCPAGQVSEQGATACDQPHECVQDYATKTAKCQLSKTGKGITGKACADTCKFIPATPAPTPTPENNYYCAPLTGACIQGPQGNLTQADCLATCKAAPFCTCSPGGTCIPGYGSESCTKCSSTCKPPSPTRFPTPSPTRYPTPSPTPSPKDTQKTAIAIGGTVGGLLAALAFALFIRRGKRRDEGADDSKTQQLLGVAIGGAAGDEEEHEQTSYAPAPVDSVEQHTSDIGQYTVGGRVSNLGAAGVNGVVTKIEPDYPGGTAGGGTITIAKDAPGFKPPTPAAPPARRPNACSTSVTTLDKPKTVELATSNIAQYHVGGLVANLGPDGNTHGVIRSIVPDEPGATEGSGRIFVTPKPPPDPKARAPAPSAGAGQKESSAAEASRMLRNSGPMVLVNRKICVLDVTGGRIGTVVALKKTLGKATQHVVRFDAGGAEETIQLQKSDDAKGVKFTLFS